MKSVPSATSSFNPGKRLYHWKAYDYHPHDRGLIWHICFGLVVFGAAVWSWFYGGDLGWLSSFGIFLGAAVYFWIHKDGNEVHQIEFFEFGFMVDGRDFFPWDKVVGYWILFNETVSVIKFVQRSRMGEQELTLQLGDAQLTKLKQSLKKIEISELGNRNEAVLDLWLRVFKL